jgi:hypothetical protein
MMGGAYVDRVSLTDQAAEYILAHGGNLLVEESKPVRAG